MLEVYSYGDLYQDWGLRECSEPRGLDRKADPERRRVRMQEALWLAMALATTKAVTITYQHENRRNILRLAPPDSEVGDWTASILYVLGDGGAFEGWERIATKTGASLSDRDRDRLMVHVCSAAPLPISVPGMSADRERAISDALAEIREHTAGPLVLVTGDADLIRRARKQGVDADEPKAIAARTMTREQAKRAFEARLHDATSWYLATRKKIDGWLRRAEAMERIHQLYAAVWSDSTRPWFPPPAG